MLAAFARSSTSPHAITPCHTHQPAHQPLMPPALSSAAAILVAAAASRVAPAAASRLSKTGLASTYVTHNTGAPSGYNLNLGTLLPKHFLLGDGPSAGSCTQCHSQLHHHHATTAQSCAAVRSPPGRGTHGVHAEGGLCVCSVCSARTAHYLLHKSAAASSHRHWHYRNPAAALWHCHVGQQPQRPASVLCTIIYVASNNRRAAVATKHSQSTCFHSY